MGREVTFGAGADEVYFSELHSRRLLSELIHT